MNFSAVILAGGKSSRMGRDKAYLEIEGRTLLARQIEVARNAGAGEILISGGMNRNYAGFGCHVLRDEFSDAGPLAGIESALAMIASPILLVLAVDLGAMTAGFLQSLAMRCDEKTGAIPRLGNYIEPLAAFYPGCAAPLAESLLGQGLNRVTTFAECCVESGLARFAEVVSEDACFFANWNSPADAGVPSQNDIRISAGAP